MSITIEAPIRAVTVYTSRARVTRRAKIKLKAGDHTLILKHLPETLESDSVRILSKTAGMVIRGIEIKNIVPTQTPEDKVVELEAQLADLSDQSKSLDDEAEVLQAHFDFLETFREKCGEEFASAVAGHRFSLEQVTSVTHYIMQQTSDARAKRRDIEQRRAQLNKEIEAQKRLVRRSKRTPDTQIYEAHIATSLKKAVTVELEIVYVARAARWRPHYEFRLLADGRVEVNYLAAITQRTGEDWSNVEVTLSTSRPAVTASLPELPPWYVDEMESGSRPSFHPVTFSSKGLFDGPLSPTDTMVLAHESESTSDWLRDTHDTAEIVTVKDEDENDPQAFTEEEEYVGIPITVHVPAPVSVPSDGAPHRAVVALIQPEAKLDYLSAPKVVSEAYLRVTLTNASEYMLLAGEASLFRGAEFVSKQVIDTFAPKDSLTLQFGAEDRIQVQRQLLKREIGKDRITSQRCMTYAYKITAVSHLPTPICLLISDQLPLSKSEKVQIRLEESAPAPKDQNALNLLEWSVELQPETPQDITFSFTVEYPAFIRVQGLEA